MEKINIPLVFEGESNIFNSNERGFFDCDVFNRRIPIPLQFFKPLISVHLLDDIPDLDWFIFPIIIDEPSILLPILVNPHNPKYGFWSLVPDKIINSLKNDKGWIFIDICLEPASGDMIDKVLRHFDKDNDFPVHRVIFNHFPGNHQTKPNYYSLPTWSEIAFIYEKDIVKSLPEEFIGNLPAFITRKVDLQKIKRKKFCLFNMRWWKHAGATFIQDSIVYKLNLEKYGHVSYDNPTFDLTSNLKQLNKNYPKWKVSNFDKNFKECEHFLEEEIDLHNAGIFSDFSIVIEAYYDHWVSTTPFITEKIFRTIKAKKPFILIGQKNSLSTFHNYGYKSFHPYIDESYDNHNNNLRAVSALSEIIKLLDKSESEMEEMNLALQPVFDHNIANFDKRVAELYNLFVCLKNGIRP